MNDIIGFACVFGAISVVSALVYGYLKERNSKSVGRKFYATAALNGIRDGLMLSPIGLIVQQPWSEGGKVAAVLLLLALSRVSYQVGHFDGTDTNDH